MKNLRRVIVTLFLSSCVFMMVLLPALAAENSDDGVTEMNQVMSISADCEAKEAPDANAAKVMDYAAGDSVWVIGETQDGWYKVSYQGTEGYIPKENTTKLLVEVEGEGRQELSEDSLNAEMEALEAEGKLVVEEVERQRSEKKRSRIWIIVIVVLVVAILAVGIFSARKPSKSKKRKKKSNSSSKRKR